MNNFLAVTHEKNKVGWIHESKIGKFDIKSLGSKIDLKELLRMCLKSENKSKNIEYCPIFKFDSLKPKIKFNHKENFCNDKIFKINRKYLSTFGLPAYGVHCNVWSKFKSSTVIHLAKRSKKLKKFPGYYDNLIAGGQPINISIQENLYKEAYEEAGLKEKELEEAIKSKTVHYVHNDKEKLNSAIIFIYHLQKNKNMKFRNLDGEVDDFISIDIESLYKILETKKLKPNCIVPIIDFFIHKKNDFISNKAIIEINKIINSYD